MQSILYLAAPRAYSRIAHSAGLSHFGDLRVPRGKSRFLPSSRRDTAIRRRCG